MALMLAGAVLVAFGAPGLAQAGPDPREILLEVCQLVGVQGSDVSWWANFDSNMDAANQFWKNHTPDHCLVIL